MAKIAVLDIAASKTGALAILQDFYRYVRNHPDGNEWIFVTGVEGILEDVPEKKIRVICRSDIKASSGRRLLFDLFSGKDFIQSLRADIVFSLQNTLPRGVRGVRQVLYVHQPLGYQRVKNFSFFRKEERALAVYQHLYSILVNASVRRSDRAFVQTEWMREAVIRKTGVSPERIVKLTPKVEDLSGYGKGAVFDPKCFFFPAGDIPYKNHKLIKEAEEILAKKGITDYEVILTTGKPMKREEVYRTYFKSTLLFPSYIETFGLPLAEASQTGNPILAADTPFAREILREYPNAFFFDPFSAGELAKLMEDVLEGRIAPLPGKEALRKEEAEDSYGILMKMITDEE